MPPGLAEAANHQDIAVIDDLGNQRGIMRNIQIYGGEAVGLPPEPSPSTTGEPPVIISKTSIRARAQQDAAAADPHGDQRPPVVYTDNPDAQAEYEAAYARAMFAAGLAVDA